MVDFMTQVANIGKHMTTREQIIGYFKSRYPEDKRWRSEIARKIQPFTKGKNGQPISYQNARRRFEGSRPYSHLSPQNKAEYVELGKTLPKMQPERGYHVKGKVCIQFSTCEERDWDFKVIGENADHLYKTGSLQGLVNVYMGEMFDEEDPTYPICGDEDGCKTKMKVYALSVKGEKNLPNIDGTR